VDINDLSKLAGLSCCLTQGTAISTHPQV